MAQVNLGSIKFKWKGTYNGATSYTADDVVEYNGSSYICILASTGNLPTNATYFEQMSQAGTNGTDGTDLGTTLTTQGDIVYRDASGLARLPAGSANQVLQSGGAGANPSWGTVSSDYVKLASGSVSGSSTSVSIDGFYSSDYKNYKLFFQNLQNGNTGTSLRFNFGGSPDAGGGYRGAMDGLQNASGSLSQVGVSSGWNNGELNVTNWGATNGFGDIINLDIFEPQSTSYYKRVQWFASSFNSTEVHILTGQGYFHSNQNTASTGVTFLSSGTMTTGDWYLYGIKG